MFTKGRDETVRPKNKNMIRMLNVNSKIKGNTRINYGLNIQQTLVVFSVSETIKCSIKLKLYLKWFIMLMNEFKPSDQNLIAY